MPVCLGVREVGGPGGEDTPRTEGKEGSWNITRRLSRSRDPRRTQGLREPGGKGGRSPGKGRPSPLIPPPRNPAPHCAHQPSCTLSTLNAAMATLGSPTPTHAQHLREEKVGLRAEAQPRLWGPPLQAQAHVGVGGTGSGGRARPVPFPGCRTTAWLSHVWLRLGAVIIPLPTSPAGRGEELAGGMSTNRCRVPGGWRWGPASGTSRGHFLGECQPRPGLLQGRGARGAAGVPLPWGLGASTGRAAVLGAGVLPAAERLRPRAGCCRPGGPSGGDTTLGAEPRRTQDPGAICTAVCRALDCALQGHVSPSPGTFSCWPVGTAPCAHEPSEATDVFVT